MLRRKIKQGREIGSVGGRVAILNRVVRVLPGKEIFERRHERDREASQADIQEKSILGRRKEDVQKP